MVVHTKPAGKHGVLPVCILVFTVLSVASGIFCGGQTPGGVAAGASATAAPIPGILSASSRAPMSQDVPAAADPPRDTLSQWEDLPVRSISFVGVQAGPLGSLTTRLAQSQGKPLSRDAVQESLRQLFATGLYDTLTVEGLREKDGVNLIFRGTPRRFIGTVSVYGAKGATVNTQLESAAQLSPGTRFTQAKLTRAMSQIRNTLAENGYHDPAINRKLTPHPGEQLEDVSFQVDSGSRARVGTVTVTGDSGMSTAEFCRVAHLRTGAHMDRDTASRALSAALKHFRRQDRMEAEIKLESEQFDAATGKVNFRFSVTRGPVVKVVVEGASVEPNDIKRLVPIFEEGTVDDDLLNEGNRRLRDYFQRQGYFEAKVDHAEKTPRPGMVEILYTVDLGRRRSVEEVSVAGNHYFSSSTLKGLLSVHAADTLDRHGIYSQALVSADVSALEAAYQNNGFANVKVTPDVSTAEKGKKKDGRAAPLNLVYRIEEGPQLRVGTVRIEGNEHVASSKLTPLMNTAAGQLLSPQNLAGDRDTLVTDYMSRGFNSAQVQVTQQPEKADPDKVDVVFHVDEGPQTFVRNVLMTGLHYTHPGTVARAITVHAGDPLNESALAETQRNLYNFGLFNEVNAAVQNPTGDLPEKTILLQAVEARRWALTYGFGFEVQTGQPQNNCKGEIASGIACSPNGKTGVSPRVLADITRDGLFGREESASLQGTYGLLEQSINLLYQIPHFEGNQNLGFTFSGGYANSQDVTTYVASRLEGGVRFTENFRTPASFLSRANTIVYEYDFRRVKVAAGSLQVCPCDLTELSTATRVAGPSLTWIRDTRDSPLDAHRGTYTSFQDFVSDTHFEAQADFNRIDVSNSSYYAFDKGRFVLARNTRYGQVRSYGTAENDLIPLPERLYAGGALSLRGFSQNAAGPRDPETGYPVGGGGVLVNQAELRLPPPTLPWFGNTLSFVLFHDMGNAFADAGDIWESALRIRQPDRASCESQAALTPPPNNPDGSPGTPSGPVTSTGPQGQCSFNYFSHAPGVGLRYHTPVGPIRLDFSYNLNPPVYPVIYDYSLTNPLDPHVGEASHFNFFFSLGQSF